MHNMAMWAARLLESLADSAEQLDAIAHAGGVGLGREMGPPVA